MNRFRQTISLFSYFLLLCAGCESPSERLMQLAKTDKKVSVRIEERKGKEIVFVGLAGEEAILKALPLLGDMNVVVLGVGEADLSQTELELIARLPLHELNLGKCTIDVEAAECLGRIESLEELTSSPSYFTDDDLKFLGTLKHLKRLRLNGQEIHGQGMRYLAGLDQLEEISLTNCPITDEGLACLPKLPRLETIWVGQTLVTPTGLRHLAPFTSLKKVYDPGFLSDEGIKLHRLHLEAREAARQQGISVPNDDVVPYDGYANMSEKDRYYLDLNMQGTRRQNRDQPSRER